MKETHKLDAIILASGFSKRFKSNKLKAKINGKEIFKFIIDLVEESDFSNKIIVTNDQEIKTYAESFAFKVVENKEAHLGKSTSIKKALECVASNDFMIFVSDQPFLKKETVNKLIEKHLENPEKIIYPIFKSSKGSPKIFPNKFKKNFLDLNKDQGGKIFLNDENSLGLLIEDFKEGVDIDTIDDFKKYVSNK